MGAAVVAMVALALGQVVSTLDKGILNLLIDPVRRDLGASDVQMSLLQGLAFTIFYVAVGVPASALADRVARTRLLAGAIAVWSLATVWGGLSHNFAEMFASRLLVGMGEALLGPCAVTMIADMFPLSRRNRAMSFYVFASSVSAGLSSLLTAAVLRAAERGVFAATPFLSTLSQWRLTFVVTGIMGLVVTALLLLTREPARRGLAATAAPASFRAAARYAREHWQVLLPFYLGIGIAAVAIMCVPAWGPTMLIRAFHMPAASVGVRLGNLNILAAVVGTFLAWGIVSAAVRRWGVAGKLKIAVWFPICCMPSAFAVIAPTPQIAIALMSMIILVMPTFAAALLSATTDLAPPGARGIFVSLYALSVTLIGGTIGPSLVAGATEHVFRRPEAVGWSIMIVAGPALAIAAVLFALSYMALRRQIARGGEMAEAIAAQEAG